MDLIKKMVKKSREVFPERINTNIQKVHKNTLNITNHQKNK